MMDKERKNEQCLLPMLPIISRYNTLTHTPPKADFFQYTALLFGLIIFVLTGCVKTEEAPTPTSASVSEYVGDETCASCHESVYMSYHRTGMGKSVSLFDSSTAPESFSDGDEVYHPESGYYYRPFVQNDTLFQSEYRKDSIGRIIHERIHPVDWVVGSGNATRSYFMDTKGYITQMPLTWYADSKRWDLSPAYEQTNRRFGRPIGAECMTCHNAVPEHSPFTQNHYTDIPQGISCERCHGPGSEHVNLQQAGLGPEDGTQDASIVNPKHLDRDLNLSVCQQCHLTGITVFKEGEGMHTYQPGSPLTENRTVFAPEEQLADPERFGISSHAARLSRSACYTETAMTCVTCHNPHTPVAELEDDYFNETCRSCHTPDEQDTPTMCSREASHSIADKDLGNCISCHMQKSGTSDIPHVTFTDHWIRKTLPEPKKPEDIDRMLTRTTPFKLVQVEGQQDGNDPAAMLEEGIAYYKLYETRHKLPEYLPEIIQSIRTALNNGADHPEGRLSLGKALIESDSLLSAERVLQAAAMAYPEHARIHYWLGFTLAEQSKPSPASDAFRAALNISPEFNEARLKLAIQLAALSRFDEAEQEYLEVIRRDSVNHPEAWNNLGFLYLNVNRLDEALPLFEQATALDPQLPIAWTNAGSIHLYHGELEKAASVFERALDVDAEFVPAIGNLAQVYWQMNRPEEAKSMLRRLLQINPNDRRALSLLNQWN